MLFAIHVIIIIICLWTSYVLNNIQTKPDVDVMVNIPFCWLINSLQNLYHDMHAVFLSIYIQPKLLNNKYEVNILFNLLTGYIVFFSFTILHAEFSVLPVNMIILYQVNAKLVFFLLLNHMLHYIASSLILY